MHGTLERQISKLVSKELLQSAEMQAFLQTISDTYTHHDEDRALIERSLDISSKELSDINQALRQERDRAKAIITSIRDGLVVVDQDQTVVSLNPAAERLLQLKADTALGKKAEELCQILYKDQPINAQYRPIALTLQRGQAVSLSLKNEISVKTNSGQVFPVAVSTVPLQSAGGTIGAVVTFRDITDERQATAIIEQKVVSRTQEVQESRAELMASITTLDLGFVLINHNLVVTMTNPAAERITKLPQVDSLDLLEKHLGNGIGLKEACRACMELKRSSEFKDLAYNDQFLHLYLSPIIVAEQTTGVAIIIEDITEGKIIERSKDEFFSIASHELRTPLTAIRGNTSLMQKFYQDQTTDPTITQLVKDIHESSIQMIHIVNDFLDLSRLEQRRMTFKKEPTNLDELISSVVLELNAMAVAKGLKLVYNRPSTPYALALGDSDRLKQVLINFIGNGIKYTEHGCVAVDVAARPDTISVLVSDTGIGVSPHGQTLLFRKFQQAGESIYARDTTRGTGLGLYISKLMIEGMGGTLKLEKSEVGKGSTFSFALPVYHPAQ